MNRRLQLAFTVGISGSASAACTHSGTIGLLSDGDLEGRVIDATLATEVLAGESCGPYHYLESAFRDALGGTVYDTLIDVEVTTTTGIFVIENCLKLRGERSGARTYR